MSCQALPAGATVALDASAGVLAPVQRTVGAALRVMRFGRQIAKAQLSGHLNWPTRPAVFQVERASSANVAGRWKRAEQICPAAPSLRVNTQRTIPGRGSK